MTIPQIIQRLMALDRALSSYKGLDLDKFAQKWGVDDKTIRRDVGHLKELGKKVVSVRGAFEGDKTYRFKYRNSVPLFTKNVPPSYLSEGGRDLVRRWD